MNYVQLGGSFLTGSTVTNDPNTSKTSRFPLPLRARYVKLRPMDFEGEMAFRAALVTCGPRREGRSANYALQAGVSCDANITSCGCLPVKGLL